MPKGKDDLIILASALSGDADLLVTGGKELLKLAKVENLLEGKLLDPLHHDHKLIGKYQGRRECHIEADWLLIYKVDHEQVIFERTGTHSDLFKK